MFLVKNPCFFPVSRVGGEPLAIFFSDNLTIGVFCFRVCARPLHPHPRAQFSKSPTRMRQTFGLPPDLVLDFENWALGRGWRARRAIRVSGMFADWRKGGWLALKCCFLHDSKGYLRLGSIYPWQKYLFKERKEGQVADLLTRGRFSTKLPHQVAKSADEETWHKYLFKERKNAKPLTPSYI